MGQVTQRQHQDKVYIYYSRFGKVLRHPTQVKWSDRIQEADVIATKQKRVQDIVTEHFRLVGNQPSVEYVQNKLKEKQRIKSDVFMDYFDDFFEEKKLLVRPSSLKDYVSFKNSILDYQDYHNINLTFDRINIKFGRTWSDFLLSTDRTPGAKTKGGMNDKTVSKRLVSFRNYMKWLETNEYAKFNELIKQFKPVTNYASDYVHLSIDEQRNLYNYNQLSAKHKMVRDIFIFSCLTSLRYSDIVTLKPRHISPEYKLVKKSEKGRNNEQYVQFLNKTAIEIWEKYDRNLNRLSNQKFNQHLHDLCQLSKLFDEPITQMIMQNGKEVELEPQPKYKFITSHTGRRSFITNHVEQGTSINKIMEMTSHKKIDTLMKYLHKSGSDKETANKIDL